MEQKYIIAIKEGLKDAILLSISLFFLLIIQSILLPHAEIETFTDFQIMISNLIGLSCIIIVLIFLLKAGSFSVRRAYSEPSSLSECVKISIIGGFFTAMIPGFIGMIIPLLNHFPFFPGSVICGTGFVMLSLFVSVIGGILGNNPDNRPRINQV